MPRRRKPNAELVNLRALSPGGSDHERLLAYRDAFVHLVPLPVDAHVLGEPVEIAALEYDGNVRRGLTASCRKGEGMWAVSLADVEFREGSTAAGLVAGYRLWMGLEQTGAVPPKAPPKKKHKAEVEDLPLDKPVELVVLAVRDRTSAARCRILGSSREITLRAQGLWKAVPAEIVTVQPAKAWSYAGHPYLSGKIDSVRLDVSALGLVPLKLEQRGVWEPKEHYWGEDGEPLEDWARPIFERGPRPEFELEQVVPGDEYDPEGPITDGPILEAIGLHDQGDCGGARKILMNLLGQDLRCLDAHAHLGNFAFGPALTVKDALKHYEVGFRIGEVALGSDFTGLLPWACVDNRPFLRCLHGYGLCLWRLGRAGDALAVFERLLWLNPTDNQGARLLLADVKSGKKWEECYGEEDAILG